VNSYAGDPRFIVAKVSSVCAGTKDGKACGQAIRKGDRVFYYPTGKRVLARACGCADKAYREFFSMAADECGACCY